MFTVSKFDSEYKSREQLSADGCVVNVTHDGQMAAAFSDGEKNYSQVSMAKQLQWTQEYISGVSLVVLRWWVVMMTLICSHTHICLRGDDYIL